MKEKINNKTSPYECIRYDGQGGLLMNKNGKEYILPSALIYIEGEGASYLLSSAVAMMLNLNDADFFKHVDAFLSKTSAERLRFFEDYLFVRIPPSVYDKARVHLCHKLFIWLMPFILGYQYTKPLEEILTAVMMFEDEKRKEERLRTGEPTTCEDVESMVFTEETIEASTAFINKDADFFSTSLIADVLAIPHHLTADKDKEINKAIHVKARHGFADGVRVEDEIRLLAERGRVDEIMARTSEILKEADVCE